MLCVLNCVLFYVCVCVCVCMSHITHTHTHTLSLCLSLSYTHICTHYHSLSHTRTYTHLCTYYTHTYTHTLLTPHTHTRIHTHTHAQIVLDTRHTCWYVEFKRLEQRDRAVSVLNGMIHRSVCILQCSFVGMDLSIPYEDVSVFSCHLGKDRWQIHTHKSTHTHTH